jgi:hypothetical protein
MNAWSYTSIPQYVFMPWYLVKDRDKFPLLLLVSTFRRTRFVCRITIHVNQSKKKLAMGCMTGVQMPAGAEILLFTTTSIPSLLSNQYRVFYP